MQELVRSRLLFVESPKADRLSKMVYAKRNPANIPVVPVQAVQLLTERGVD